MNTVLTRNGHIRTPVWVRTRWRFSLCRVRCGRCAGFAFGLFCLLPWGRRILSCFRLLAPVGGVLPLPQAHQLPCVVLLQQLQRPAAVPATPLQASADCVVAMSR